MNHKSFFSYASAVLLSAAIGAGTTIAVVPKVMSLDAGPVAAPTSALAQATPTSATTNTTSTIVQAVNKEKSAVVGVANITPAVFGNSASLNIGEPAIAIGNPLGEQFAQTVTTGVISALNRNMPVTDEQTGETLGKEDVIQTDAAIQKIMASDPNAATPSAQNVISAE